MLSFTNGKMASDGRYRDLPTGLRNGRPNNKSRIRCCITSGMRVMKAKLNYLHGHNPLQSNFRTDTDLSQGYLRPETLC